jgi:hypothetical protein
MGSAGSVMLSGAEESMTCAVSALADVAPVADVARIASTAHELLTRFSCRLQEVSVNNHH